MNKQRCRFNNNTGEWEHVFRFESFRDQFLLAMDRAYEADAENRAKNESDLKLRFSLCDWDSSIPADREQYNGIYSDVDAQKIYNTAISDIIKKGDNNG